MKRLAAVGKLNKAIWKGLEHSIRHVAPLDSPLQILAQHAKPGRGRNLELVQEKLEEALLHGVDEPCEVQEPFSAQGLNRTGHPEARQTEVVSGSKALVHDLRQASCSAKLKKPQVAEENNRRERGMFAAS